MTRFTKALVLAGAAAMVMSPMVAGAAGSTLSVLAQGASQNDDDDDDVTALLIGSGLVILAIGVLVGGSSKSN